MRTQQDRDADLNVGEEEREEQRRQATRILTNRPISHDEASEAFRRFENHYWRKSAEGPRIGIPARPDYDDDLVILAYIEQQRTRG